MIPLDCVYEIVADLGHRRRAGRAGGWVDLAQVVSMAGRKALAQDIVVEAIYIWECLGVLGCNLERNMVRFLVPPLVEAKIADIALETQNFGNEPMGPSAVVRPFAPQVKTAADKSLMAQAKAYDWNPKSAGIEQRKQK